MFSIYNFAVANKDMHSLTRKEFFHQVEGNYNKSVLSLKQNFESDSNLHISMDKILIKRTDDKFLIVAAHWVSFNLDFFSQPIVNSVKKTLLYGFFFKKLYKIYILVAFIG